MFIVCLNIGDNQANQSPQLERWDWGTVGLSGWHHVLGACTVLPPPSSLSSSLLLPSLSLSLGRLCRVYRSWSTWTQLEKEKERQKEPLNLVHSIMCSVAVLSHSWEILNTLYDNKSAGDRHKYQRQSAEGWKCLVRLLRTQIRHWFHGFLNC